jgi:hypothetical protein
MSDDLPVHALDRSTARILGTILESIFNVLNEEQRPALIEWLDHYAPGMEPGEASILKGFAAHLRNDPLPEKLEPPSKPTLKVIDGGAA